MKNIKLSIILPIYNVESYLRKCISSVLNQTLQNIEVILATDGPDSCDAICSEFAAKDNRVKVIWHPGSYGKACNQGMNMATGEYIGFVETDDWCHPQMFEKLYAAAKAYDADVCKGGFFDAYDDAKKNRTRLFYPETKSFHIAEHPDLLAFQPSIWSGIYKSSFIKKNSIYMIEDRMPFIDGPFHMEALLRADVVANVAEPLYYYYHDNPNQSVQNEKASFAGLKAEEIFYSKNPLGSIEDATLRAHTFRATLAHLQWDYERLTSEEMKSEFKSKMKEFFDSLPMHTVDSSFIEEWRWSNYLYYHGKFASPPQRKPEYKNFWERIFYVKNRDGFKVVNILGWKIKTARKKK